MRTLLSVHSSGVCTCTKRAALRCVWIALFSHDAQSALPTFSIAWTAYPRPISVFWDVRPHLPFGGDRRDSLLQSSSPQEMTSSQLLEMVTESSMLPTLPFGHTVLVANSKNEWYREWNRGGRPIMDHVAQTMMRELLSTSNEN
mmetsp:Transcript_6032/g.16416  ORF Transcript_6032/g.16416 Transcript_6032/m.16416 type:complete len:144 (+) Transcript_6032:102-533(+)